MQFIANNTKSTVRQAKVFLPPVFSTQASLHCFPSLLTTGSTPYTTRATLCQDTKNNQYVPVIAKIKVPK